MPGSPDVLFIVRGRGRGHALDALAIESRIKAKVQYVSYGTGAATLREHGRRVSDLRLPDNPEPFALDAVLPDVLERWRPRVVVAHEEFDVPTAALDLGAPCLFLTDWFLAPRDWRMQSLRHAHEILFLDELAAFQPPRYLASKVFATGPILRPRRRWTKKRAREEAGLPERALVVAVFIQPGRRTEAIAPLERLLQNALALIAYRGPKVVVWDGEYDRTIAAADLAITKGNRNIVRELASAGVPTISLSYGLNVIDDIRTPTLACNRTLTYAEQTPETLAEAISERLAARSGIQPVTFGDGASAAAERVERWLQAT